MNKDDLIEEYANQAIDRLNCAADAMKHPNDEFSIREAHKHIHRAQTYIWALETARLLNDK